MIVSLNNSQRMYSNHVEVKLYSVTQTPKLIELYKERVRSKRIVNQHFVVVCRIFQNETMQSYIIFSKPPTSHQRFVLSFFVPQVLHKCKSTGTCTCTWYQVLLTTGSTSTTTTTTDWCKLL